VLVGPVASYCLQVDATREEPIAPGDHHSGRDVGGLPSSAATSSSSRSRLIAFAGRRSIRTRVTAPLVSNETKMQHRLRGPQLEHDRRAGAVKAIEVV